jgi:mannose-6-phosphate isomerase-like protein (cupin superfamily)
MSHLDPALVDVRTVADHPLVSHGATSSLRMGAPGAVTAGRYGLAEYRVAPNSPGAAPHYHRTFSESFYVLSGRLTVYAAGEWRPLGAG